jgi:hypothetical protein
MAVDDLLKKLDSSIRAGSARILVVRRVGITGVRVTVASSVEYDELAEADGCSAEDAAAQLLWRTP